MLPNAQNCPSKLTQFAIDLFTSGLVPRNLGGPIFDIRFRFNKTTWAPVPKTAVYKHRNLLLSEYEIRPPRQLLVPSPSMDTAGPKNLNHLHFGACVTR